MTTWIDTTPQFCLYAIHGQVYVDKRGGSYWEPEDELRHCAHQNNSGVVLVDCETEELSRRIRCLLDAQGLIPGVDYGIYSLHSSSQVSCPGISVRELPGRRGVDAYGNGEWKMPPRPPALAAKFKAMVEAHQSRRLDFYQRVALALGTDPAKVDAAGQKDTHEEGVSSIIRAITEDKS
jgi:hypothetical protein